MLMLSASTQPPSKEKHKNKATQKHNPAFLITFGFTYDLCVEQQQRFTATSCAIKAAKIRETQSKATGGKPGHAGKVPHCEKPL